MATLFERIIAGELPCAKVYEDAHVFAFMDADEVSACALMAAAHRIARAVQAAFAPPGMTLLQANRAAGWQTVPHLHMHVLPRHENDGVGLIWPRKEPGIEKLKELAARIKL